MTEFVLIWLVAPALLFLVCLGLGLLLTMVIAWPKNLSIITASGFLLVIIFGSLLTASSITAPYTAFCVLALSVIGLIFGLIRRRSSLSLDYPSVAGGLITYVVFGLPVMAYGKPSWAGWVQLDDTASFLAVTDRIMSVGQSVPSLVTSTFGRIIQVLLGGNGLNYGSVTNTHFVYPIGTFVPIGVLSKLTTIERAWLFQPYLSFVAALSAMLFVTLLRNQIHKNSILIAASCVSIAASTIYSYVMWGGIKEIVIIVPITLLALTLFGDSSHNKGRDRYLYALICSMALYFIGGMASFGFAAVIIMIFLFIYAKRKSRVLFVGIPVLILLALLGLWVEYLSTGKNIVGDLLVPKIKDSGNLSRPLNLFQAFGIWPSQDFRADPVLKPITFFVIALVLLFSMAGFYFSIQHLHWIIPSLVISVVAVVIYSNFSGGIWLTGKALAVASPFLLLAASLGLYQVWDFVSKSERKWIQNFKFKYVIVVLATVVGSGVLISDIFTYKNTWLAPYSQVNELRAIGVLYSGQGPALMTEYSVFGARYFLRNLDAESASELRVHVIPMSDGQEVPRGFAADIGLFDPNTINYYKILVLRKSPTASRPPLNYQLVWTGKHYEVWKRNDSALVIKKMMPLGNNFTPGSTPTCQAVSSFLSGISKGDGIYTVRRDKTYLINFSDGDLPPSWIPVSASSGAVDRTGPGGFSRQFSVDETSLYDLSIAGSFPGQMTLLVDGSQVYSGHSIFEGNPTLVNSLTKVQLSAGTHVLTLVYETPLLMSGSDVAARFGPIYLSTQFAGDAKMSRVSLSDVPRLCTENLDWLAITN